jgi:hemerythrin superfamily protein
MATNATSRAASAARNDVLSQLIADHKRVRKAYKEFEKLDAEDDAERCEEIVQQVLQELTLHAALEEEFLYPAARGEVEDDLLDEAEVEHESMHTAIDQLRGMSPSDEKYAARFTVLCEYVLHHVKEEEGQMFPQLERAQLDWASLAAEMNDRRAGLSEDGDSGKEVDLEDGPEEAAVPRSGSKTAATAGRSDKRVGQSK